MSNDLRELARQFMERKTHESEAEQKQKEETAKTFLEAMRRQNQIAWVMQRLKEAPTTILGDSIKCESFTKLEELIISRLFSDNVKHSGHRIPTDWMYRVTLSMDRSMSVSEMIVYTSTCPDCSLMIRMGSFFDEPSGRQLLTSVHTNHFPVVYCNRVACMK